MNCLRCGRETSEDHVFCDKCREEMENFPVHPGTAVMLPRRRNDVPAKKSRHHVHQAPSPEEQIKKLRKQRAGLSLTVAALAAILVLTSVLLVMKLQEKPARPGQNYSAMETTQSKPNP